MSLDFSILYWIQENMRCGFLDFFFPKFTHLGNGVLYVLIAVLLLCTKKYRKTGIILAAGLILDVLVGNLILKYLVARSRPCWIDTTVQLLLSVPKDYSFPSGHTQASVTVAFILFRYHRKVGIGAIIFAILIAFSRLYLFVHFPSDVLGGAITGFIIGWAVCKFVPMLLRKYPAWKKVKLPELDTMLKKKKNN